MTISHVIEVLYCSTKQFQQKPKMYSTSGKIYDKTRIPKPLNRQKRLRVYASYQMKSSLPKRSKPKFSPFSTVGRTARDSYLLRVTNQPNIKNNYDPNHSLTLPLNRRATIDRSNFTRIIGQVRNPYQFQKPFTSDTPKRCIRSISDIKTFANGQLPKPLTTRDCQSWRKTFQNYDFQKMPVSLTQKQYKKKLQSTSQSFFDQATLSKTIQSNFNNYKRFSLRASPEKAHDFNSDQPHKYLVKQSQKRSPQYDTLNSRQDIIKKAMSKAKGEPRFFLYRDKVATRKDRADPLWNTKLEYEPKMRHVQSDRNERTIDFEQTLYRELNLVHSKYPMRQNLSKILNKKIV